MRFAELGSQRKTDEALESGRNLSPNRHNRLKQDIYSFRAEAKGSERIDSENPQWCEARNGADLLVTYRGDSWYGPYTRWVNLKSLFRQIR